MRRWTDSHAHLDGCDTVALDATVAAAAAAGVFRILNAATSLPSSEIVAHQCARHDCLLGCVGISPFDVHNAPDSWEASLRTLARRPRIAAVGETGIDATNPSYPPLSLQTLFFEKHLALARELDLPAIVHSRGCEKRALDMCKHAGVKRAVFHCYAGPLDVMKDIFDAGYLISFSGIVTFAHSPLAPLAAAAPLDSFLIETDTPYLAPVPHRGRPNRPAWVACVGETIATIRGMDAGTLAAALEKNFTCMFEAVRGSGQACSA